MTEQYYTIENYDGKDVGDAIINQCGGKIVIAGIGTLRLKPRDEVPRALAEGSDLLEPVLAEREA